MMRKRTFRLATGLLATICLMGCGATQSVPDGSKESISGGDTAKSSEASESTVSSKGADGTGSEGTVVLTLWGGVPAEAGPQASCDEFNKLYKDKGIEVEYQRFVNDETGNMKLETNLLSGEGVDLYMTYTFDSLAKRAEGGMALDLSDLMSAEGYDEKKYLGDMAEAYYVDGKPYSIPTKLDKYGIVLNKDMFDEAGIDIPTDWTIDEFREIAKKLTHGEGQDKVYGMFWNSQQDLTYPISYIAAQTLGGDPMYKSPTESNFTDPVNIAAIDLVNTMMNVDGTSPTHTDSVTQKLSQEGMFLTGKCAMTVGPWMIRSIKDTATYPHDFETAFAPYPVVAEGQRKYTQGGYGDLLCINPKSEHIKEAWEFAKWYASEGMLEVAKGGRVPAYNTYDSSVVTKAFLDGAENLLDADTTENVLIKPADNYAVPSITNHISEVKKCLTDEVEKILIGQESTEAGMKNAKIAADKILQQ